MPVYNALVAGIGGQGVITLGTLLKRAALKAGIHVSGSERRGGAQREGHVSAIIRYRWRGDGQRFDERHEVCSPLLHAGSAHLLIGLEPLEAARQARYLNGDSIIILNSSPLFPIPVRLGEAEYPSMKAVIAMLERLTAHIYVWNLTKIARENFGQSRAMNAISLGIASRVARLPVSETHLRAALEEDGRPGDAESFQMGVDLANERS
ncbi:MAG: 2-oxoacid:acceptor oxidoreductase family protein [Candidatus Hydrogenedentota bacterium]|nr:MAG: 2-oxoacid:acceptor oxidoreductase family protein [Candidatus Hydrogenedentota bacterium]